MRITYEVGDVVEVVYNSSCGFKAGTICVIVRKVSCMNSVVLIDEDNIYSYTMSHLVDDIRSIY